jgi:hypothetical protein
MIGQYVSSIATKMGMRFSQVSPVDNHALDSPDVFILDIPSKGTFVRILLLKSDLDSLWMEGNNTLEERTRIYLSYWQNTLES